MRSIGCFRLPHMAIGRTVASCVAIGRVAASCRRMYNSVLFLSGWTQRMSIHRTAVYPGTFDPITNGHTDLVSRAARVFTKVIVGIAESPHKKPLFSLDERIAQARNQMIDLNNVEVVGFSNLLVEFVQQIGAGVIVRGLRAKRRNAVPDAGRGLQLHIIHPGQGDRTVGRRCVRIRLRGSPAGHDPAFCRDGAEPWRSR